jgi:hypothetical protein
LNFQIQNIIEARARRSRPGMCRNETVRDKDGLAKARMVLLWREKITESNAIRAHKPV